MFDILVQNGLIGALVRARKLTIAEGQGVVHGIPYDLERQLGLRLAPLELT